MGYLRYNVSTTSGNANGIASASTITGSSVMLGQSSLLVEHLTAIVTVLAETSTLTFAEQWQVSNDKSTWFSVANAPQNPATVVLATGTTGTDSPVTKVMPAPEGLYGYKFARACLVTGGTTGATTDTYSIGYSYRAHGPMARPDGHLQFDQHIASGNATGVGAGGQVNGKQLFMGGIDQKVAHVSALITALAETNTLTLSAKWQGSNDGSTWLDLAHSPQNPAAVALATGTSGTDTAVTTVVPAPASAYGYKFARCSLVVGVTTGTTNDTYSIGYSYRQFDAGGQVDW